MGASRNGLEADGSPGRLFIIHHYETASNVHLVRSLLRQGSRKEQVGKVVEKVGEKTRLKDWLLESLYCMYSWIQGTRHLDRK